MTVDDIYFSESLYPPSINGLYHYYAAEDGSTYLIVKVTAKNLKGYELKPADVATVSCTYEGKYKYRAFCAFEKDGGSDLSSSSWDSIAPLNTGVCYFLIEVPSEVEHGTVEVSIFTAGSYYYYDIG